MPISRSRAFRNHNRNRRGQAMVEYSMITYLIGVVFILGYYWHPGGQKVQEDTQNYSTINDTQGNSIDSGSTTMFGLLMQTYQIYNNSYYYALDVPLP